MKVQELIEQLTQLPADAEVAYIYDGMPYGLADNVWLARSGTVIVASTDENVYRTEDRPAGAPTKDEDRYWHAPGKKRDWQTFEPYGEEDDSL
ncbi:hypothetical protein B7L88_gp107 [Rhizobium phage RHEph10]|uniref:hypothetical protein n=1 Tax=Rhizobium phage RHEph10 TaxID=1220717 RepID=UPI0002AB36DC|nr:hypothetical protein B7L88_gp107 [Rhizobium phage RHEph10]AGC36181.1 hypothetical protein RHEph10_gp138 [Rhizobium phage RHEph10]